MQSTSLRISQQPTLPLLLLLCVLSLSACGLFRQKCPTCQPSPPPKIVEVEKPCASKLPTINFRPSDWPDPNSDGTTTLDAVTSAKLLALITVLINYAETQHGKCQAPKDK